MSSVAEKKITVPDFQAATNTDEIMQKAKDLIGVWLRRDVHWAAISEPISQIDIRRWAVYSVRDDNPLWCDADYAKGTIWGKTIAPPQRFYTRSILPSWRRDYLESNGFIGEPGGSTSNQ